MNTNDPNEKKPDDPAGQPPIPDKWKEPSGLEFKPRPEGDEVDSAGMTFLKVIGYLLLGFLVLVGLAFGTCLLLLATNH